MYKKDSVLVGWHFINNNNTLQRLHNGKRIKVRPGLVLNSDPRKLKLCCDGLHASLKIIDALEYSKGWKLCRVISTGKFEFSDDKYVSTQREVLYIVDFKLIFKKFISDVLNELLLKYLYKFDNLSNLSESDMYLSNFLAKMEDGYFSFKKKNSLISNKELTNIDLILSKEGGKVVQHILLVIRTSINLLLSNHNIQLYIDDIINAFKLINVTITRNDLEDKLLVHEQTTPKISNNCSNSKPNKSTKSKQKTRK